MAGDWIKVEHSTLNKPEVLRLARMWGVTKDHAFGVVVRFWVWADNASVDGLVDGVASHELDAMMLMPGFAQGMVAVGWLKITEEPPCISIPHFSEHNGETSKKRALRNKRQAQWRSTNVDTDVDGRVDASISLARLPEKRREENTLNTCAQPDGFAAFWAAYPKKRSKGTAVKAWVALRPNAELTAEIIAAIAKQITGPDWTKDGGQFIPHPATWLKGRRWEDELTTVPAKPKMVL